MARLIGPVCKLCRREGMKLFLKGDRCYTDKCSFDRRNYGPGQHGQGRGKISEYALQLREKQKVKRLYGLMEGQFRNTFKRAERIKGVTGVNLMQLLERRFDNVVYRLGFANSRSEARMLITQGLFTLNGKKNDIPSTNIKNTDTIAVNDKKKTVVRILESIKAVDRRGVPDWLSLDKEKLSGTITRDPAREDITLPIQEQLIVELYSK